MENLTELRNSAEEREQLYRWFASCFAYEMTNEQLDFYSSEQGKQFLEPVHNLFNNKAMKARLVN